jgi:hypothetical protein
MTTPARQMRFVVQTKPDSMSRTRYATVSRPRQYLTRSGSQSSELSRARVFKTPAVAARHASSFARGAVFAVWPTGHLTGI